MRNFTKAVVVGAASLSLLLAACGGGEAKPAAGGASGGAAAGGTQALKMEDIKFDKTALSGAKGEKLTVNLTNAGALEHDFTIDKIAGTAQFDGKDAKTDKYAVHAVVKAKGSGKVELTPTDAGSYEFYCTVAGHKEAGMKGTLTVK